MYTAVCKLFIPLLTIFIPFFTCKNATMNIEHLPTTCFIAQSAPALDLSSQPQRSIVLILCSVTKKRTSNNQVVYIALHCGCLVLLLLNVYCRLFTCVVAYNYYKPHPREGTKEQLCILKPPLLSALIFSFVLCHQLCTIKYTMQSSIKVSLNEDQSSGVKNRQ
jgi:hypothetical protein